MRIAEIEPTFDGWRQTARVLLAQNASPGEVWWQERGEQTLLSGTRVEAQKVPGPPIKISKGFLSLAEAVACYRDPQRWSLLYHVLWRMTHGERSLLDISVDPQVNELLQMEKAVRFDAHKMTAFVRFRRVERENAEYYIAWHQPAHLILRRTAPFFVRRFGAMNWSILTPDECAHWDGKRLSFSAGVERSAAPAGDELETLWGTYYSNIFNPARIKLAAMKKEMPVKYWRNMPETALIAQLLKDAPRRVEEMMARKVDEYPTAKAFLPERISLPSLTHAAEGCQGCPLYKTGTQTVFGEGRAGAKIVMIGEQPGDQEDQAGKPFVGPAGKVLDDALEQVGIDREIVYVTNAVKHFKWEPKGLRRIHSKPNSREIQACKPWLEAELQVVKPEMIVCLGATAAQTLMGREFRITRSRGEVFTDTPHAPWVMATVHPSSILRVPAEDRDAAYEAFVQDLKIAAKALKHLS